VGVQAVGVPEHRMAGHHDGEVGRQGYRRLQLRLAKLARRLPAHGEDA
jgi:hypothetical protein